MLDAQFIRDNLEAVKANCKNRNVQVDLDKVVACEVARKEPCQQTQAVQQRQNEVAKLIPKEKDPAKKQELIQEGRTLREQAGVVGNAAQADRSRAACGSRRRPEHDHPDAPVGTTAEDNKVIRRWGEPRKFDFPVEGPRRAGEAFDLVDFEAGASVAGQKFYFLKNEAVLLELALVQYAMGTLQKHGYTPIITPDLARVDVLEGIGFMPRGPETQIYSRRRTPTCA